ncbi:hypothetical protein, partial [Nitratireductor pacificus]
PHSEPIDTIAGLSSRIGETAGARSVIELRLSKEVEARILQQSMMQSVQISTGAVAQYDGNMPVRVRGIIKDRRAY